MDIIKPIVVCLLLSGVLFFGINWLNKTLELLLHYRKLNKELTRTIFDQYEHIKSLESRLFGKDTTTTDPKVRPTVKQLSRKQKIINLSKNTDNPHEKKLAEDMASKMK